MKTFLKILKYLFLVWGVFTFGIALLLGVFFFSGFYKKNVTQINKASPRDVAEALNVCGLGAKRIQQVVHSYESYRSFGGDHVDAYAILLSHVDESELTSRNGNWIVGDYTPHLLADTIKPVGAYFVSTSNPINWFPKNEDLLSENYYIYIWTITMRGNHANAAQIIFVTPETKMLYYFSVKT